MSTPVRTVTNLVDLSHPLDANHISNTPGLPQFACCPIATVENDGYRMCSVTLSSHTGTHIDAPSHFIASGKSIDEIPLTSLVGRALVVDLTHKGALDLIEWNDLAPHSSKMTSGVILLLYTGWSKFWASGPGYWKHPYCTTDVAEGLIERGVKVIGIDFPSPDKSVLEPPFVFPFHQTFLGGGGCIVENLTNLGQLEEEPMVNLLPINLVGSDGAPVRAIGWQ